MKPKKCLSAGVAAVAGIAAAIGQPAVVAHSAVVTSQKVVTPQNVAQPAPATATAAQLRTVVPAAAQTADLSSRLVMWWQEGTTWHVALSKSSGSATAALKAALGQETVVTTHAPVHAAVKVTKAPESFRLVHVRAPIKRRGSNTIRPLAPSPVSPPPYRQGGTWNFSNRLIDGQPYSGGDRIFRSFLVGTARYYVECTAATLTNLGMLSAGHCDQGRPNTIWQQGYFSPSNRTAYYSATYGTTAKSVWANGRADAAVIKAPTGLVTSGAFNKTIYLDTQYSLPSRFATDVGSYAVKVGSPVCSDGSFSDLRCGGKVVKVNICLNVNEQLDDLKTVKTVRECGLDETTAATPIVQMGDSGGAVLAGASIGASALTVGVISAEGGTTNPSKDLFFTDIKAVNSTLGTTEVKG